MWVGPILAAIGGGVLVSVQHSRAGDIAGGAALGIAATMTYVNLLLRYRFGIKL